MPALTNRSPLALPAAAAVAAVVPAGVWVAGGVVTDDYRASMALTGAWLALAGLACLLVARRRRALRLPVLAAYAIAAGATVAFLGATTLRDDVVHERVITAAPAPAPATAPARPAAGPAELARGRFRSHEHATAGTARVIRDTDGRRYLTLTSFSTSPGPDLRVRLVPAGSADGGGEGAVDLGALKGNRGDQQYALPRGVDVAGHAVLIWCRAFSAPFGGAELRGA